MLATAAIVLLVCLPADPPAKPEQPVVKFVSAGKNGVLTFQLTNPNADALRFSGYRPDSFDGGLKEGTIAPLYCVEVLRGKEWHCYGSGSSCGFGWDRVSIPGKSKATFTVDLPDGKWDKVRVGVTWYKSGNRKGPAAAWSDALGKDEVARKRP